MDCLRLRRGRGRGRGQKRPPSAAQPEPGEGTQEDGGQDHVADFAERDAKRVANPDILTPFKSLDDVIERLLPYHVRYDVHVERT
jgi:hypothetical protein